MIRLANKFDIEDIYNLIFDYCKKEKLNLQYPALKWSKTHIYARVNEILAGHGFILIDDKKTSVLIALKTQVFWMENELHLVEIMLHSKYKITAIKLIKEYKKIALDMKNKNEISKAIISSKIDTDFSKLGFDPIEMQWGL